MNAGHFRFKNVSTGDLNRPRSPEVRKPLVYFWFFSYKRKARKTFLSQGASRFCKPQISPPQPQLRTATIKTFLRKLRGYANLESAHQNSKFAQTKLNPFFPPFGGVPAGTAHSVCFCAACGGISRRQSRLYPFPFGKLFPRFSKPQIFTKSILKKIINCAIIL
jgi:hypothetical protein